MIVEQAIATFDHIDALVNNAGINDKVGLENGNPQQFVCSLEWNLRITTIWRTMRCRT
jgi:L-fucose dehydrogenase